MREPKMGKPVWFIKQVYDPKNQGSLQDMMMVRVIMELRRLRLLLILACILLAARIFI